MPPRSSIRQRNATPARSTRAAPAVQQDTPSARRSTRAASRQPVAAANIPATSFLPDIQTQQSYAYGSSKTSALPEQLHVRNVSLFSAANELEAVANAADRNLEARAAQIRGTTPESQVSARDVRAQNRASRQPSTKPVTQPQPEETPDHVRKIDRTAAWVNSSDLDDIAEEDSTQDESDEQPLTPILDREGSLPSSFPTGDFDHSYNYEREVREPRLPLPESETGSQKAFQPSTNSQRHSQPRQSILHTNQPRDRFSSFAHRARATVKQSFFSTQQLLLRIIDCLYRWIRRIFQTMQKCIVEIPESSATIVLFKSLLIMTALSIFGLTFCTIFTHTCNSSSTSVVVQSLQRVCGQCSTSDLPPLPEWNLNNTDTADMNTLVTALKQIEARLNLRIDSFHVSHKSEIATLRAQHEALELQIRRLGQRQPVGDTYSLNDVPSPLFKRINFFNPTKGAAIIPSLTSPSRTESFNLPYRIALRMLGIRKTLSPPPVTALEPWLDEGECWCAADVPQKQIIQDTLRLGVQLPLKVFPTELVIEHFPASASLEPGTAPKGIELWADFTGVASEDWKTLHIKDLIDQSPEQSGFLPLSRGHKTWARIGTATYVIDKSGLGGKLARDAEEHEMAADEPYTRPSHRESSYHHTNDKTHEEQDVARIQKFSLSVNQHGLLHYSDRFVVRVKSNHGAGYTCLYRVRLHGLPYDSETQDK